MEYFFVRISPDIMAMIILVFMIYLLRSDRMVQKNQAKAIRDIAFIMLFIIFLEVTTVYLEDYPSSSMVNWYKLCNAIGFSLTAMIALSFAVVYTPSLHKHLFILFCPALLLCILSVISMWTGWIFHVDDYGFYTRGPLFAINIAINIYSIAVYLYALKVKGRSYDQAEQITLLGQFYIIILGDLVQIIFPKILLIWPCFSLVLFLYYDFLKALTYKYDSLTNVKNRRCFDESIEDAKDEENLYIVTFDINNLKDVNDEYGHVAGDEYIREIAEIIKTQMENMGVLYRIGGDEFCCLCTETSPELLNQAFRRIEQDMHNLKLKHVGKEQFHETIAYGYAYYSKSHKDSIDTCLMLADQAMYQLKRRQKLAEEANAGGVQLET